MTNYPLFPVSDPDNQPLPVIVAQRWEFPLATIPTDAGLMYAIQDWIRGLTGDQDTRYILSKFKKTDVGERMWNSIQRLPYKASDGRTYQRDYTNDEGLYLIAQYLRVKSERPVLDAIRRFLAEAGAFVDEVRREPDGLFAAGQNPDRLIDAFIEYHRRRGKDDRWIQMRIESKIRRNQFTAALAEFVRDVLTPRHYATATDDVYNGLWGRKASELRQQLQLRSRDNLRDHQPTLALYYQGIVEEVCAHKLGERDEVWWEEARDIIRTVGAIIGRQAKETGELMGHDLATGQPLLP
jgi:hypothetical protein